MSTESIAQQTGDPEFQQLIVDRAKWLAENDASLTGTQAAEAILGNSIGYVANNFLWPTARATEEQYEATMNVSGITAAMIDPVIKSRWPADFSGS